MLDLNEQQATNSEFGIHIPLFDGVFHNKALHEDLLLLPQPMDSIVRLRLHSVVPRQVQAVVASDQLAYIRMTSGDDVLDDPVGRHEVEANATTLDAAKAWV